MINSFFNLKEDYMNLVKRLEKSNGSTTDPLDIRDVREELTLSLKC
jgi:hypothetical protein